jgi:dienelactone hydrolase
MAQFFSGILVVNGVNVNYHLILPRGCSNKANGAIGRRIIIAPHGHGGDSNFIRMEGRFHTNPGSAWLADHSRVWADAGYVVGCIETGPQGHVDEWFDNDAIDRQNALINYLQTTLGCKVGRVGFSGMSMGGGTALAYYILNPGKVSAMYIFAPATDLQWLGSKAGYVPPYSINAGVTAPDPTWATELSTDYPSGYVTHDPIENIPAYRNPGIKIKIVHGTDDTLIPYNASTYFVNQVNDPNVTMRSPDVTGGHSVLLIDNIPTKETLNFFINNWVD